MEKDFENWHLLKQKLDARTNFKRPQKREIWWVSVGVNVGSELYGKGAVFSRPVLVINVELEGSFIGIPLTSSLKTTKHSCIIRFFDEIDQKEKLNSALVHQIRLFDNKRLTNKIGLLSKEEFSLVASPFHKLFKLT